MFILALEKDSTAAHMDVVIVQALQGKQNRIMLRTSMKALSMEYYD